MLSDDQIIRRVIAGRIDAFAEIVRRHQAGVFGVAYGILGRREDAEDAAQETFVRVFRSLDAYTERGKFAAWLRRITVNTCLKRLPREYTEELDEAMTAIEPVEAHVIREAESERVREAIALLAPDYRAVLVLRYHEELSYKEIADALGEPVSTVQVRLHRAKKALAERLAVVDCETM